MALPTNVQVYGDISPRTAALAMVPLLERGHHLMVTELFGDFDPLAQNKTKTVKWRRYNSLARASAPLAEGVPPVGQKPTVADITATLEQYGDAIKLTDVIADTHEDPVLKEYGSLVSEQAAETIEEVRINFMKAGTNVYYAAGVASRATVNSPPTHGDFQKIYRSFKINKAQEISEVIAASAMISTEPVDQAYFVLGHTNLDWDIAQISGFVPAVNYSHSTKAFAGEVGKVGRFRFILTPMFDPWLAAGASGTTYLSSGTAPAAAASCDVYPLICIAKHSYSIVPLKGYQAIVPMVVNPGKPTAVDPLGQIGFVSWKTYQAGAILNELWIARLECAATANPT